MEMDERLMADFACLEPVYADGIAGLINLGENYGTLLYRWQRVGPGKLERVPALYLVRPRSILGVCRPNCYFTRLLDGQTPPATEPFKMGSGVH